MSPLGTKQTCRPALTMSVAGGRSEVAVDRSVRMWGNKLSTPPAPVVLT